MTVYVEVPYYGEIQVEEEDHFKLVAMALRRRITEWRELTRKIMLENGIKMSVTTFAEWLHMAYMQKNYWIYKRLQVVKILYQSEDKKSRKSPMPFADVRAWIYRRYDGDKANEELQEGTEFHVSYVVSKSGTEDIDILHQLDFETTYLLGIFPSIVCAYYKGSIADVTIATEVEIVDEDEVEDVDEVHRSVIIYRHNIDFAMAWNYGSYEEQKYLMELGIELPRKVGVYKDEDIEELERAMWRIYQEMTGRKMSLREFKEEIVELVETGEWGMLVEMIRKFGYSC